ncbi:MAG TPA: prephenate dehydrogenase/arogenate dehydrogenase family protein [Rickettsiales bacterium]|nr:prephenate dehydrogenase/arogenate dehydrogenase family protein [Rickettsiales bacterium]
MENELPSIGIIGLGFMGIALAKSLKNLNYKIFGYDVNEYLSEYLLQNKILNEKCSNIQEIVCKSNIVFLATPVSKFESIVKNIKDVLTNQIIVDIGSVKRKVYKNISEILKEKSNLYVPSHPIVGGRSLNVNNLSEELKRIPNNLFKENIIHLFSNLSNRTELKKIQNIFEYLEMKINKDLTLKEHDEVYAITSHLPFFLSAIFLKSLKLCDRQNLPYLYFLEKMSDLMWYSILSDNIYNLENVWEKIKKYVLEENSKYMTPIFLSDIYGKVVNNYKKYKGKGCNIFLDCKINNKIEKIDFINNGNDFIKICKKEDLKKIEKFLTKIMVIYGSN